MSRDIAIHESAHAVAGICLGRRGLLTRISIVPNSRAKGGCEWNVPRRPRSPSEEDQAIGIGLAGPIGQVLHAPDSLGAYVEAFASTILQPDDILEKAGCAGWASTDLTTFIWMRQKGLPVSGFFETEKLMRSLLSRSSVTAAIVSLAAILELELEIVGDRAEKVVIKHLAPEDLVGADYLK